MYLYADEEGVFNNKRKYIGQDILKGYGKCT